MSCPPTAEAGLKLLTSPPVFDSLYAFCRPGDLCRVAKTCNGASQAVTNYVTHRFTIDLSRLLLRFFASQEDVLAFRRLQAKHQFLISGSAALQLLDRAIYPDSDLDLYLFPNDAEAVGNWLTEHGYEFSPYDWGEQTFEEAVKVTRLHDDPYANSKYALPGLHNVLNFRKIDRRAHRDEQSNTSYILEHTLAEIQLIISDVTPYEAILKFHTSVVMNIVTWDRAIALFPRGTLDERRGIKTPLKPHKKAAFREAVAKYRRSGFSFLGPPARFDGGFELAFKSGHRFFGDEHSWVVHLDTAGIDPPDNPVAVEGNSWELKYVEYRDCFAIRAGCFKLTLELTFDLIDTHHAYCVGEAFAVYVSNLIRTIHKAGQTRLEQYIQFFNEDPAQPLARLSEAGDSIIIDGNDVQIFKVLQRRFRDVGEVDVYVLIELFKNL